MKTIMTQLLGNENFKYKQFHKVNNNKTRELAATVTTFVDGFVSNCFSYLCLKGNRKSMTFLLPFHFAKKEGALC